MRCGSLRPDSGRGGQEEVAQWLDNEWIERSVHRDIGSLAAKLIEEARRAGDQVRPPSTF